MKGLIVTVDGPAGSGKSSVSRHLAARLGVDFLDTGAMYRAIAVASLRAHIDPQTQPDELDELARRARVTFDWSADPPRVHLDGQAVDQEIRDPAVTDRVSLVASRPAVRQVLVREQQRLGVEHPRLVTEGRDQGSVVFPQAAVKFYLDAAPEVRARRRAAELAQAGKPVDPQRILAAILDRDQRDATRTDGPLTCPDDAIRVDTSDLTQEQVVAELERHVRERLGLDTAAAPVSSPRAEPSP